MKKEIYESVHERLAALCAGETDLVSIMSTISCELFQAFDEFHWVGFYRLVDPETLKVGPYQGGHGCLEIKLTRGVCGQAAREKRTLNVPDVNKHPDHIACSSTTVSEIVVPIYQNEQLIAVLDIDSDLPALFDEIDEIELNKMNLYFDV